jgi:RNA polymerase sigma-70 factor (ECF subfamily)
VEVDQQLSGLMCLAQDGDARAYQTLLLEVTALVRRFTRTRVRQPEWVEDIVQETLFSIHRDRHTYDPSRPFLPWMYAIARHRLLDFVEKQRRLGEKESLTDPGEEEPVWEDPPRELIRLLRRALALLSFNQREVIRMLKLEGFSVLEISQRMGLSESSVKVTAHRGYKKLRTLMTEPSHGD